MLSIRKMASLCASFFVVAASFSVALSTPKPAEAGAPPASGIVTFQYSVEGARPANTGWIGIHYADPTYERTGYDFVNRRYTGLTEGAFYLAYENGYVKLFANNVGQGGVIELRSYNSRIPRIHQGGYTRFGVNAWQGGAYAIYDQAHNRYIRVRITNFEAYNFAPVPTPPVYPVYPPLPPIEPPVIPPSGLIRPSTPYISYPSYNQTLTNFPRTFYPTWSASINAARYVVQIQCDYCNSSSAWTGPIMEYTSYSNSYGPVTLPGDNQYRIRVKAIGSHGLESDWSPYTYFWYKTPAAVRPSTPYMIYPGQNATLTNYPRTFTPSWSASTNAHHYVMQVQCDYCESYSIWSGMPTEYTVYGTSYGPLTMVGDNQFRMRVKAVSADGLESDWSPYTYFNYRTAPAEPIRPATPVVYSPVNNGTMTQYPRMVRPTWSSSGVNTYKVQIDCDYCNSYTPWVGGSLGEYTVTNGATWYEGITLPGDNQYRVRVKAINDAGVESDWSTYNYFRFDTRSWM